MEPALPQTNPQQQPQTRNIGLSVLDLPSFGGTVDGALTGNARAAAQANLRGQMDGTAVAPSAAPMGPPDPNALPSFDASAPNLVATPANGVMGTGTGLSNAWDAARAQGTFEGRLTQLQHNVNPGVTGAISNWLFNPVGGADNKAYNAADFAHGVYTRPEASAYFGAHPSLLAHAEQDPVGFAQKLGPILDAAVSAQSGQKTQGTVTHMTPDGPMVKPDDHVEHTNAVAKAFDIPVQQAHAAMQPHHYTDAEYLHAMQGISRGALRNMWEMQHYLNPQQQALSTALSVGKAQAERERAANPSAQGMTPAEQRYYQMLQIGGGLSSALPQQPVK